MSPLPQTQPYRLRKETSGHQDTKMWGMEYHTTVDKISDQDPLYNTRKLTACSVITYKEKSPNKSHIHLCRNETNCSRRKRKKQNTQKIVIHCILQFKSWDENRTKKDILTLFFSGHTELGGVTSLEPDWSGSQGWSVLGQGSWEQVAGSVPPKRTWLGTIWRAHCGAAELFDVFWLVDI